METEGHLFDVPREPILVLFLRPKQTRAFGTSNLIVMKVPSRSPILFRPVSRESRTQLIASL
jgi:hypothetical protein